MTTMLQITADGSVTTANPDGRQVSATTNEEYAAVIYGHGYVQLDGPTLADLHIVSDFNRATWCDHSQARSMVEQVMRILRGLGLTITEYGGGGLRIQLVRRRVYRESTLPEIVGDPPKHTCADRTSADLDPDCPGCTWES